MMKFKARIGLCITIALAVGGFFVSSAQATDVIGQSRTFYVDQSFDLNSRHTLSATLQYVSNRLNIYTEDDYFNRLSSYQKDSITRDIVRLANDFDSHIYPVETGFWGSEPNPGIDRDPRMTLLFASLHPGNGGYFDSTHNYPAGPGRDSNEREMITLNFDALSNSLIGVFLGHEFQHLISSNQKELTRRVSEEVWLNEMRAEYTSSLLQQNTPFFNSSLYRRAQSFLRNPSDSLVEWSNVPTDYGIAALFAEYLAGRYGDRILSSTLQSSTTGITSIDAFLTQNNFTERFSDIFADWMVASYLNDSRVSPNYAYAKADLSGVHVSANTQQSLFGDSTISLSIKHWQPVWIDLNINATSAAGVRVSLGGQVEERPLGSAIIYYTDGTYEVRRLASSNALYLPLNVSGKQIRKVVVAATFGAFQAGSPSTFQSYNLTVSGTLIDAVTLEQGLKIPSPTPVANVPVQTQGVAQGALVKRDNGETEAYVIQGIYKRYLRPEIIALYGHLKSLNPIALAGAVFDSFRSTNYVRAVNDQKVYAIWPDGTKHWLRMTAKTFAESGRDWNSIFIINEAELNSYKTGADITK